ncbi:MAG: DUF1573 domain-containing protein [Bacteroidales bacterium]|nr:DUF1573 domain-containing protein [Bacteroidales bacterium]
MKTLLLAISVALLAFASPAHAQTPEQPFDKTVHNFGDITLKDGPQSCTFTFTNCTEEPAMILAAVSSCGCTEVKWTRESINPGEKGTVSATYSNDEGTFPFDKTLTVYVSYQKKPIILHLKGVVKNNGTK